MCKGLKKLLFYVWTTWTFSKSRHILNYFIYYIPNVIVFVFLVWYIAYIKTQPKVLYEQLHMIIKLSASNFKA